MTYLTTKIAKTREFAKRSRFLGPFTIFDLIIAVFGLARPAEIQQKKEVKSGGRISKIVIFKLLLSQIITVSTKIRKKISIIQNLIK